MKDEQMDEIRDRITSSSLPLENDANLVFGRGDVDADVFVVGEAPGATEDEQGVPFVGRSGQVLDDALSKVDGSVYIANVVKYRPPENRDPRVDEIRAHAPYLLDQIKVVDPSVIVTLGNTATEFFFEDDEVFSGISQERGSSFSVEIREKTYAVMPTYHPAATLYDGSLRSVFVEDIVGVFDVLSDD